MQEFEQLLGELKHSVRTGVRDHSLVAAIGVKMTQIRLEVKLIETFCDGLFQLYDLSNSSAFIKRPPHPRRMEEVSLDEMAVSIKGLVLKMLAHLVAFFNDNPNVEVPFTLMEQSLEMMVMISRVLMDIDRVADVRSIYGMVKTFREAAGDILSPETELAHWLNVLELENVNIDAKKIDLY